MANQQWDMRRWQGRLATAIMSTIIGTGAFGLGVSNAAVVHAPNRSAGVSVSICQSSGPVYYVGTWQGSGMGFGGPVSGNAETDVNASTGSVTLVYTTASVPVTISLPAVTFMCSGTSFSWTGSTGSSTFSFTGTTSNGGAIVSGSFTDSAGDSGTLTTSLVTSQITCSAIATCSTGDLTSKATPIGVTVTYPGCATPGTTSIRATSLLPQSAPVPVGHTLDGIVVAIAKPSGTAACAFVLHFAINASVEGGSTAIPVFEDGQLIPSCNSGTPPSNPPCAVMPESAANSETTVTVYSPDPTSSYWAFANTGAAPLAVSTRSPLPRAAVGQSYAESLQATGGAAPYRWTVAGGHLPKGLTLSSGGVISGTPPKGGKARFTVGVMDGASRSAKSALSLTVG